MKIRQYNSSDRAGCIEVFASNTPEFFDPVELNGFESWLNACDKAELAFKTNALEKYFVITEANQVIGCGGFYIIKDKSEARMAWGMVKKNRHKQGIGKMFLKYRIDQIKEINPACSVALDTTQHCNAFFEKMGFKAVKFTPDAYVPGLHRYDMVLK